MKRSDIKVGGEYAVTRVKDWTRWFDAKRVRVVDLGPFAQDSVHSWRAADMGLIDGTPTKDNYRRSDKGTAVAVRYLGDDFQPEERVRFVSVSHFKATWADYEETKDVTARARREQDQREAQRRADVAAERNDLAALLAQVNLGLAEPVQSWFDANNQVVMSRDNFRTLLSAALAAEDRARHGLSR